MYQILYFNFVLNQGLGETFTPFRSSYVHPLLDAFTLFVIIAIFFNFVIVVFINL